MRKSTQFCAWSLGLLLVWMPAACAQEITSPPQAMLSQSAILSDLAQANVVYLGETHDRQDDHIAQLQIIQELHQQNPDLAIALEMFQRPYQEVLDQYLAGEITEDQLRQRSEYDRRWGFPWSYYAPILRFAKENQLPVIALNTPTEITRRVAQKGLDALNSSDLQWVPPVSEISTEHPDYRQMLQDIYEQSHQGHGSSDSFDNFFEAQVLWDETMADGIADFLQANPQQQVVVLAGQGHLVYGYGIPDRVARRLSDRPDFAQRIVLLSPTADAVSEAVGVGVEGAIADYFWTTLSTDITR